IERTAAERARGEAHWEVLTEGEHGGTFAPRGGEPVRFQPAPLPAAAVDSYGSGDAFAAGLTFGLAAGMEFPDALALAARCFAACLRPAGSESNIGFHASKSSTSKLVITKAIAVASTWSSDRVLSTICPPIVPAIPTHSEGSCCMSESTGANRSPCRRTRSST